MITVIIPTYRNPKYLDLCLKSITENSVLESTQVIVIIDGYVEENQEVMAKYPTVGFLPFEQNMGMQYAINAGVMQSSTEYVFIVNDDNVFPARWDERLQSTLELMRGVKTVMTINQLEPTGPGMFEFPVLDLGQSADTFQYDEFLIKEPKYSTSAKETPNGHIFPFIMNKKHFMAVGGFDTFYNSPNICDWDFFLKLELLDFTFFRSSTIHLYHFGSVSTKKNAEKELFQAKEQAAVEQYIWKWGAAPYNQPGTNSKIPPNKQFRGFVV